MQQDALSERRIPGSSSKAAPNWSRSARKPSSEPCATPSDSAGTGEREKHAPVNLSNLMGRTKNTHPLRRQRLCTRQWAQREPAPAARLASSTTRDSNRLAVANGMGTCHDGSWESIASSRIGYVPLMGVVAGECTP